MPAEEVVNPQEVKLGNPYIDVISATLTPLDERPMFSKTLELRRCEDPAKVFIQVGPMRYEVLADNLVDLVNRAFPYAARNVKDVFGGKFEIRAMRDATGEALRRAFHALHRLSGTLPARVTGPLDLIAEAVGVSPAALAHDPRVFGCALEVDAMSEVIVIDHGPQGFPFSVTIIVVDEAEAT